MACRKIKDCGETQLVQKVVDFERKIPKIYSTIELAEHKEDFTKSEYLTLAQQFNEKEMWDEADWKERKLLAPLLDFSYDHLNHPILTYPRFTPLMTTLEAYRFEEEEIVNELHLRLAVKGMTDDEIGKFLEGCYQLCRDYALDTDDIIGNVNNIGWHDVLGVRIIDFGLSDSIYDNYLHWEDKDV